MDFLGLENLRKFATHIRFQQAWHNNRQRTLALMRGEFIRRILQHVLPAGFMITAKPDVSAAVALGAATLLGAMLPWPGSTSRADVVSSPAH